MAFCGKTDLMHWGLVIKVLCYLRIKPCKPHSGWDYYHLPKCQFNLLIFKLFSALSWPLVFSSQPHKIFKETGSWLKFFVSELLVSSSYFHKNNSIFSEYMLLFNNIFSYLYSLANSFLQGIKWIAHSEHTSAAEMQDEFWMLNDTEISLFIYRVYLLHNIHS